MVKQKIDRDKIRSEISSQLMSIVKAAENIVKEIQPLRKEDGARSIPLIPYHNQRPYVVSTEGSAGEGITSQYIDGNNQVYQIAVTKIRK